MNSSVNFMESVRSRCQRLSELFEPASIVAVLNARAIKCSQEQFSHYMRAAGIESYTHNNRPFYHRGHILVAYLMQKASRVYWEPWEHGHCDLEDVMSRRTQLCELHWEYIKLDATIIDRLFRWIWSDDILKFSPADAVHIKSIIDMSLDKIDSSGFLESLQLQSEGVGAYLLVRELLAMQSEISHLLSLASDAGSEIPSIQHLVERGDKLHQVSAWLHPVQSPYLACPCREILADERMAFFKVRNHLIINELWQDLAVHYEENRELFEGEVKTFAKYFSCLGRIYGERLNDHARAIESFTEALNYDIYDQDAYRRVKHYLRESKQWQALVELLSNHWDGQEEIQTRCEMQMECAEIQAKELGLYEDAINLMERAYIDGLVGGKFDFMYQLIEKAVDLPIALRLRACCVLSGHVSSIQECDKFLSFSNALMKDETSLDPSIKLHIQSGIQNFVSTQEKALLLAKEAAILAPSDSIIQGLFQRIFQKSSNFLSLLTHLDDLGDEDIKQADLAKIWMMLAYSLSKIVGGDEAALSFFERALLLDNDNIDALNCAISISHKLGLAEKQWIYTALLKENRRTYNKEQLENQIEDIRLLFADDEARLVSVYEQMLSFAQLRQEGMSGLLNSFSRLHDSSMMIDILQRVESRYLSTADRDWIANLYASVFEREISGDIKKGVLERYLGFLLGQGDKLDRDLFIHTHADLFLLAPSERLFSILKSLSPNSGEMKLWANLLEDKLPQEEEIANKIKVFEFLAHAYEETIADLDRCVYIYEELLRLDPKNVQYFKKVAENYDKSERFSDYTLLITERMPESIQGSERLSHLQRALELALLHIYDLRLITKLQLLISSEDKSRADESIKELVRLGKKSQLLPEQILSILTTLEDESSDELVVYSRLARIELLLEEKKESEALALFDIPLLKVCEKQAEIKRLCVSQLQKLSHVEGFASISKAWDIKVETPASSPQKSIPKISKPLSDQQKQEDTSQFNWEGLLDSLRTHGVDALDLNALDEMLKGYSNREASLFSEKIATTLEDIEAYPMAENYYKKSFALTQSDALLDFYKRRKQGRKALKILQFKISKEKQTDKILELQVDAANIEEQLGDYAGAMKRYQTLIDKYATQIPKTVTASLYNALAKLHVFTGEIEKAVELLNSAGSLAELKQKEEIDVDCAFLLRDLERHDEAKKLFTSLKLRGTNSHRMTLLSLCFDIDEDKFEEAQLKLDQSLKNPDFAALKLPLLEQRLRLQDKRKDNINDIKQTASLIIAIDPTNPHASNLLK